MPASTETPEDPRDTREFDWEELERRVADFEAAWYRGERPQVSDHLNARSPQDGRLMLELVHTELELRIKAGEEVTADDYLEIWPELAGQSGAAEGLRAAEHRLRQRMAASRDTLPHVGDSVAPLDDETSYEASISEAGDVDPIALPTLPGYRFVREVGRGGMGIVYEAIDLTLDRTVAIKTDRYHCNFQERSRLRREAESAARLQHPNVAQVFQVVEHAGRVYVVSEFLPSGTLADRIAAYPLAAHAAAALLEPLAAAIAYAHGRGVIHRDLKPANVLFTADGIPKVADFGLAKLISDDNTLTRTSVFSGSPAYMSPEQAAGRRDVGPETDIWSLGIILYELLTSRPPFRTPTVMETLDQLRTVDPVSPRTLVPTLPRDLETVCLKCLEKLPANRYATAHSLVTDLRHFLKGEAVAARPIGRIERTRRWALRHRSVAVLLILLAASLLGGATAVAVYANEAARNAELSKKRHKEAEVLRNEAAQLKEESAHHEQRARTLTYVADLRRAGDAIADGLPTEAAEILDNYQAEDTASHAFAFHYLNRSARAPTQLIDMFRADQPEKNAVWFVRLSPDRQTLAACGANGEIRFYETATWQKRDVIAAGQGEVNGLAFTSDGRRLASAGDDGSVVLWDLATRMPIWKTTVFEELAFEVAFGLDESLIAVCGRDQDIHLLDAATGQPAGTLTGHTRWVQSLAVTPDGTTLFSASEDHAGMAWDLANRQRRWATSIDGESARLTDISVSDDGQWVVFGAVNTALSLNDVETGKQLYQGGIGGTRWDGSQSGSFRSVGFLPGSRDLVIAIESATLARARLIPGTGVTVIDDPRPIHTTPRPRTRSFVARTDDVVIASDDGAIELISFQQNLPWKAIPFKGAWELAWVRDAVGRSQIAVASDEGQILVDPDSGKKRKLATAKSVHVATSADGRHVLFSRTDGSLDAYDLSGETPKSAWSVDARALLREFDDVVLEDAYEIVAVPFAGLRQNLRYAVRVQFRLRDGETLRQGLVNLDARTGQILRRHLDDDLDGAIAASSDGRTLAACLRHGYVQFLDGATLRERQRFRVHHDSVSAVTFCPQTGLIAAADHGMKISLRQGGVALREWLAGNGRCDVLKFSPDGRTLIACGRNRSPKLWDVATGRLLLRLDGRPSSTLSSQLSNQRANFAQFSPDGRRIAVSGENHLLIFDGRPPINRTPDPTADTAPPVAESRS